MKKLLALILLFSTACTDTSSDAPSEEEITAATTASTTLPYVKTTTISEQNFSLRLRANGTIEAARQALIKSPAGGEISQLVEEGQFIKKGQLLAQLDDRELVLQKAELEQQLVEAAFNRDDLIIRYGGQVGVDSSLSQKQMEGILIQSGYTKTERALDRIQFQIDQSHILAPFSGRIADRKVRPYERIAPNTDICTLIDPNSLEIAFQLLEQEVTHIKIGQSVIVSPVGLSDITIQAKVSIINPQVDANGLVRVRARLRNYSKHRLFTGMNALVSVERVAGKYLTVPKSAVVERSERLVVFTYDEASRLAKWKYVTVAYENDTEAAISEGLEADDIVIYDGNLNLDHDSEVRVE